MNLRLLPEPKDLVLLEGLCLLDANTIILIPAQAGDDAFFAARQLQEELWQEMEVLPAIVKAYAPPRAGNVILLVCGPEQAAAFGLEPVALGAGQAYALTIQHGRIVLYADEPAGLFYAVQTLRQLIRLEGTGLPTLEIRDWPTLAYRGLMLDISRRKVPTLTTLKILAEELSQYKLNVLQLYTEHTFQFPRHPKIGAGCGSLSSEDILALDAFCRERKIELMPNLNSFGHMRSMLMLPEYQHLAETDLLWTLSPAFEETYTLLGELFGDMLPAFSSTMFNVGCDETYDLGQGHTKAQAGDIGVGRVYLNHILRVRELATRFGHRVQVWGDILLHHPELIGEVPDDVTLLDWHYAPADEYPTARIFAEAGRKFWVCPGVGSWNSLFPRLYGANINIRNFVRDGVAAGAEGMLNTDWGDFGHYQPLGLSWHGYVFGAAQGWTGGTTSDEEFDAAFGPLFFGKDHEVIMMALHDLARTNDLPGIHYANRSYTVLALFDEPLTGETVTGDGALPAETLINLQSLAKSAAITCDALSPDHPRELTLLEMAYTARLTAYAARKTARSQWIRADLDAFAAQLEPSAPPTTPPTRGTEWGAAAEHAARLYEHYLAIRALDGELENLRAEFESLWMARSRRSEIHSPLAYFANLRSRYKAAAAWLLKQREVLLAGQPLDAGLSTYDVGDYRTLWQNWPDM
jgi:hexosaminidase